MRGIPDVQELSRMADSTHHVVLEFPRWWWLKLDKTSIISILASSLPEHSVFDSGGDRWSEWITVMSVVSRTVILNRLDQIKRALAAYINACTTLIAQREVGTLPPDWTGFEHGRDVRFQNEMTGQIVEAPLSGAPTTGEVDPYFFTVFVKTTGEFPDVVNLLIHDFHDARHMLDIVLEETAQQSAPG